MIAAALFLAGCGGGQPLPSEAPAAPSPPADPPPPASGPAPAPVPPPAPAPPRRLWFIDPHLGDDRAAGDSPSSPRRTVPPRLDAGDTVLFRRGTTTVFAGDYDPRADDVVFDAYLADGDAPTTPKPTLTLSGTGSFVIWTGNNDGLVLRNLRIAVPPGQTGRPALRLSVTRPVSRAIVLEDCDVIGDDGALVGDLSADCAGLTVRRCTFTCARASSFAYGRSAAVFIVASGGSQPFRVSGMLWEGNRVTHPAGRGMLLRSGSPTDDNVTRYAGRFLDATLRGNVWSGCAGDGVYLRCGFHWRTSIEAAAAHYGWDGLLFEDNLTADNGGAGASIGPNIGNTNRRTTIQRNRVLGNGRRSGTTGGLQLMGMRRALIQDNECRDNWTTSNFDGVNLFLDIFDEATNEMQTAGAVGCIVRRNLCSGARGAGGADYATWLAEQGTAESSNAPSSGIRLYFARDNRVYANLLVDNGSGIACDKSAGNVVFNNTAARCTMGYYDGIGMGNRQNLFVNNVALDCDWDFFGLQIGGWDPAAPTTAPVSLSATDGTFVVVDGEGQFSQVGYGVRARNHFLREMPHGDAAVGLAVVSVKYSDSELRVRVLRPFRATQFAAGSLALGSMESYGDGVCRTNARFGARVGSTRGLPPGAGDVLTDPLLDEDLVPRSGSPLAGAGTTVSLPDLDEPPTDRRGRRFAERPTIGAFEIG